MFNIAILGFGFVGSGVADIFFKNENIISKKTGGAVNIKYILDIKDICGHPLSNRLVKDINIILDDPEITLAVEAISGPAEPAYKFTKAALERGISVVTPNKAVVAEYGAELLKTAEENGAYYMFEASVGGGIPVIRPIYNCLAANKINKITGILNATTNFILSKMAAEQISFEQALKTAQELGYAERDPSSDIEGTDTCRKICILSSLAFGRQLPVDKVYTEGITKITLEDIQNAAQIGHNIKLVASSGLLSGKSGELMAYVAPMLVPQISPLYNIGEIFNGITVTGDMTGDVMFYGQGAGKLPTASAIVADIIDVLTKSAKNIRWEAGGGDYVCDFKKNILKYYVRAESKPYDVIGVFKNAVIYEPDNEGGLFFITEEIEEYGFDAAIKTLADRGAEIKSVIRLFDSNA
ncbi:MAG: homoserine dehydrogenase [Oscillospiraceae bacterium]|nr:homoserine dehydrogenase [Oscillospiraceae bacterium]